MSPSSRRTPVTDMTGRIQKRRRSQRRRRLKQVLLALLVLAVVGGLVYLVGFSPVLTSKSVRVVGNETLTADQVVETAQVPMGVPLVRIPAGQIEKRVARLPQVKKVEVHRSWPTTVEVKVTERSAVYALHVAGTGPRLVDDEGTPYLPVEIVADGMVVAELKAEPTQRVARDLATVVRALTPELRDATLSAESPDSITLHFSDGRSVVFGSAAEAALKADVATRLMAAVQATVYDVSAPSRPVTR